MSKDKQTPDAWMEVMKKAWIDPHFKEELIRHPDKILKEYNIDTHGRRAKIVENTSKEVYFTIFKKPEGLTAEDLKRVNAAGLVKEY